MFPIQDQFEIPYTLTVPDEIFPAENFTLNALIAVVDKYTPCPVMRYQNAPDENGINVSIENRLSDEVFAGS